MPLRSRNRPLQPKEGFEQGCSGYLFRGGGKGWRLLGSYPIGRLSRRLHASSPLFYYYVLGHLSDRFPCRRFCLHGGDSLFPFYPWASLGEWCGGYYQVRKLSCGGYKMRGFNIITILSSNNLVILCIFPFGPLFFKYVLHDVLS